jgi:hypothetical protein
MTFANPLTVLVTALIMLLSWQLLKTGLGLVT